MESETGAISLRKETHDALETFNRIRICRGLREQITIMWQTKMNESKMMNAGDTQVDISDIVSAKRAYLDNLALH